MEHIARYAEDQVICGDLAKLNVNVLAWIINNLPSEQDVEVALDSVACLPQECALNLVVAFQQIVSLAWDYLLQVVHRYGRSKHEHNAAELARALRAALFLKGWTPPAFILRTRMGRLLREQTHDVSVLAMALGVRVNLTGQMYAPDIARNLFRRVFQQLAAWNKFDQIPLSKPFSHHTQDILFEALSYVSETDPSLILLEDCVCLAQTFCRGDLAHN